MESRAAHTHPKNTQVPPPAPGRFIFWFQPFICVPKWNRFYSLWQWCLLYIIMKLKNHFKNAHCEFYEQFSCRKRKLQIQSHWVECKVNLVPRVLCYPSLRSKRQPENEVDAKFVWGGLSWQNLFLVILQSENHEWLITICSVRCRTTDGVKVTRGNSNSIRVRFINKQVITIVTNDQLPGDNRSDLRYWVQHF